MEGEWVTAFQGFGVGSRASCGAKGEGGGRGEAQRVGGAGFEEGAHCTLQPYTAPPPTHNLHTSRSPAPHTIPTLPPSSTCAMAAITLFCSGLSCPEAARAEAPPASSTPTGYRAKRPSQRSTERTWWGGGERGGHRGEYRGGAGKGEGKEREGRGGVWERRRTDLCKAALSRSQPAFFSPKTPSPPPCPPLHASFLPHLQPAARAGTRRTSRCRP